MKRLFALLLAVGVVLLCASCSAKETSADTEKEPTKKHDAVITKAIKELKDCWEDEYKETQIEMDGYFEIKNTRIITIKPNDIEIFDNVQYIVEFELFTDYLGSAPYHENCGRFDNVIVYEDGTMEVSHGLIDQYRSRTYQSDFSDFIQDIDDYQGYYNCIETLK